MKVFLAPCAGLALLLFSVAGQATLIEASYSVTANTTDPGLKIETADIQNPFSVDVTVDSPYTFDLFKIWTNENSIDDDSGGDQAHKSISVEFAFTSPAIFSNSVDGSTYGYRENGWYIFPLIGFYQGGALSWNNEPVFKFGTLNDGEISISLSSPTFNDGNWWGTDEGEGSGAIVQATITLLHEASAVPEPGALALFGLGLLGLGFTVRRQRSRG